MDFGRDSTLLRQPIQYTLLRNEHRKLDAVWTDERRRSPAASRPGHRPHNCGASLGFRKALRQRFCVSRSVLHEAVRLVEHHQVARVRRGPNGGLFASATGPATRAVVIYLEYLGTTIGDLLSAHLVLEPLAASLAAGHIRRRHRATVLRAEDIGGPVAPAA